MAAKGSIVAYLRSGRRYSGKWKGIVTHTGLILLLHIFLFFYVAFALADKLIRSNLPRKCSGKLLTFSLTLLQKYSNFFFNWYLYRLCFTVFIIKLILLLISNNFPVRILEIEGNEGNVYFVVITFINSKKNNQKTILIHFISWSLNYICKLFFYKLVVYYILKIV